MALLFLRATPRSYKIGTSLRGSSSVIIIEHTHIACQSGEKFAVKDRLGPKPMSLIMFSRCP